MEPLFPKIDFEQTRRPQQLLRRSGVAILFLAALAASQWGSDFFERYSDNGFQNKNTAYSYAVFLSALSILTMIGYRHPRLMAPLVLILAGGVSNMLDRMVLGFVRDPIEIYSWHGNIADFVVGIGILWAIWLYTKNNARTHTISSSIRN